MAKNAISLSVLHGFSIAADGSNGAWLLIDDPESLTAIRQTERGSLT
jgi:hypothetical protein